MAEPIDTRPIVDSHTPTEFGKYDVEPFPVDGNAYYWYMRAVYWKREANRKEGVQSTMEFASKSKIVFDTTYPQGVITLSAADLTIVKNHIKGINGDFSNKINAIKHVRTVVNCGLKEAKDYVDALQL